MDLTGKTGKKPKSILFLTTASLATNPRLVKEIRTCLRHDLKVTVVSFCFSNWSKVLNDQLLKEFKHKAELILLPGGREKKTPWVQSSLVSFFSQALVTIVPQNLSFLSYALFKRSWLLWNTIKNRQGSFDLVIAHNPGAFVPALQWAKKRRKKIGIDIEDYHPGETANSRMAGKLVSLMSRVLPEANVITAASPLILDYSVSLGVGKNGQVRTVINNVFSLQQQPAFKALETAPLKLVWFSQTVGLDRGLQDVIQAMNLITGFAIQLTLIGHCPEHTRLILERGLRIKMHSLVICPPLAENKLIEMCSQHHIGLALERREEMNRDICLTNKLFTYLLAGNAIVATNTKAQALFLTENPGIGELYESTRSDQLVSILNKFTDSPAYLFASRKRSYTVANTTLNWETESRIFVKSYNLN